jgi:hypothetical protein
MPFGNEGRMARYACSRILYCEGMSCRASSSDIGITDTVPFNVPVAFIGYNAAIGFGWSFVWQVLGMPSCGTCAYDVVAYRMASNDKKLRRKYCHLDCCACIFGLEMVRKASTGWHNSARSKHVLIITAIYAQRTEVEILKRK